MSTGTPLAPPPPAPARDSDVAGHPSFGAVCRSEYTKLTSVRSTYWTLFFTVLLTLGIGALVTWASARHFHREGLPRELFDPMALSYAGLQLAQVAIAVLGVLVISSEYTTGMVRTTFAAVPQRLRVLWAKLSVFAVVVFVVGLMTSFVAYLIGHAFYDGLVVGGDHVFDGRTQAGLVVHYGLTGAGTFPAVGRTVFGAALYLVLMGLLGLAVGAIVRRTSGAIATVVGILYVLPAIALVLRNVANVGDWVLRYLPTQAGQQVFTLQHGDGAIASPWGGLVVFALWVVVLLAVAAVLLRTRDA